VTIRAKTDLTIDGLEIPKKSDKDGFNNFVSDVGVAMSEKFNSVADLGGNATVMLTKIDGNVIGTRRLTAASITTAVLTFETSWTKGQTDYDTAEEQLNQAVAAAFSLEGVKEVLESEELQSMYGDFTVTKVKTEDNVQETMSPTTSAAPSNRDPTEAPTAQPNDPPTEAPSFSPTKMPKTSKTGKSTSKSKGKTSKVKTTKTAKSSASPTASPTSSPNKAKKSKAGKISKKSKVVKSSKSPTRSPTPKNESKPGKSKSKSAKPAQSAIQNSLSIHPDEVFD